MNCTVSSETIWNPNPWGTVETAASCVCIFSKLCFIDFETLFATPFVCSFSWGIRVATCRTTSKKVRRMLCKEVVLSIKGWSYERFFIRSQDTSNHIKLCQVKRRIKMCGVAHAGHGALGHIAPDALFSSSHDANVLTRNDNMYDIATIATLLEIINQTNGSKLKAVPNSEESGHLLSIDATCSMSRPCLIFCCQWSVVRPLRWFLISTRARMGLILQCPHAQAIDDLSIKCTSSLCIAWKHVKQIRLQSKLCAWFVCATFLASPPVICQSFGLRDFRLCPAPAVCSFRWAAATVSRMQMETQSSQADQTEADEWNEGQFSLWKHAWRKLVQLSVQLPSPQHIKKCQHFVNPLRRYTHDIHNILQSKSYNVILRHTYSTTYEHIRTTIWFKLHGCCCTGKAMTRLY